MRTKIFTSAPLWLNGLLLTRIVTGIMIFRYGMEFFHPQDLIKFLTDVKVPLPETTAYAAKIIELVGGVLLILGLFTRIITILLSFVMLGVTYTMGGGNYFNSEGSTLFLLLFVTYFFTGPGQWSLDYLFFDRKKFQQTQNA